MQQSFLRRLWQHWAFLRPQIALQGVIYAAIGMYLSGVTTLELNAMQALALFVLALIIAFGFVSNDYADVEIDRLTKPERFLPSGAVSMDAARWMGLILVGLTGVLASRLPFPLSGIAYLNLALTAAYSFWLKRTVLIGNITIVLLNSSVLIYGAFVGNGPNAVLGSVILIVAIYTLAQELLYTVDDHVGDRQAGIITSAIYFGPQRTREIVIVLLVLASISTMIPLLLGLASFLYIGLLLPCMLIPIFVWIVPLVRQGDAAQISIACQRMKWVRMWSLVPLLVLPL